VTHPRKVYRDISNSILGERVFKLISQLDREDPGRYTRLMNVLLDAGPALEAAVNLDDKETVERLAAVFDRVEQRLGRRS
jgi:hypothetical protein